MSSGKDGRGKPTGKAHASGGPSGKAHGQGEPPEEVIRSLGDPELDPFEIEFSERHLKEQRGPRGAFVNRHGVVIGDHEYASPQSPLENWSKETDPFTMAGEEWVHPYKDVGFWTAENRDIFEKDIPPQSGIFMHPTINAAHGAVLEGNQPAGRPDGPPEPERSKHPQEPGRPDDPKE